MTPPSKFELFAQLTATIIELLDEYQYEYVNEFIQQSVDNVVVANIDLNIAILISTLPVKEKLPSRCLLFEAVWETLVTNGEDAHEVLNHIR